VLRDLRQAAESMALDFRVYAAERLEELDEAVGAMQRDGCGAAVVGPHEFFNRNGERIGALFLAARIPAVGNQLSIARAGGLASFNPPKKRGWPLMAQVVERILQGTPPAEIAIDRSMKGPLTINLRTAAALGLDLPASLLEEADVLIE
jgi:putative ABC transport system substrate-binding protein